MGVFGEIKMLIKHPFPVEWRSYPRLCAALGGVTHKYNKPSLQ